jgi:putative ABC transport system permease protein
MKILDIIATANGNMFRSKLRTSLTIIAIFIGAFTLTLTNGLGSGISQYIDKEVGNLGAKDVLIIQPKGGDSAGLSSDSVKKYDPDKKTMSLESQGNRTITVLTDQDMVKIRKINGIKSAEPFVSAQVDYVSAGTSDKYIASVEQYLSGANYTLAAGKVTTNSAKTPEVLIPVTYLGPLGFSDAASAIGNTMNFGVTNGLGRQSEVTAKIVGVKEKSLAGGAGLSINSDLMASLRATQNVGLPSAATANFQYATARFDASIPASQVTDLKNRLTAAGYSAMTVEDQIGSFKAVINGIVMVLNGFAVIALLAASFGIINTLLMSVQERTKEIGLMKAMGMSSSRIFLLFSGEAVMLGFWGSLIGSVAAIGVGTLINRIVLSTFLKDLVGLQLLAFSPASVASIIGIVMGIAFVAGSLPAIRAARQNPIDSLRYE